MTSSRAPVAAAELRILGEYRGLLFVDKPAGLQTEPDARTTDTLLSRLATQLRVPIARLHALSRLDTGVSGVVTLGLSPDARKLVQGWREQGRFRRRYLGLATNGLGAFGAPDASVGAWSESIGRASGSLRVVGGRHPESAHTDYARIASASLARATPSALHLLALSPRTGRTHQLRVHCTAHGLPLLGDRAYGGVSRFISDSGAVSALDRIALHAAWVELPLSAPFRIEAPTPAFLLDIWRTFAGHTHAFEEARRVPLPAAQAASLTVAPEQQD
ncbi:MAG TPA: RNA pseudouridine synthase [Polyangiaceae bacterium]|nr:RNA pseudouridine synthase [Polyangiaceae bacterium]